MAGTLVVRVHPQRHLCRPLLCRQLHRGGQEPYSEFVPCVAAFHRNRDFRNIAAQVRPTLLRRRPVAQPHTARRHAELIERENAALGFRIPLADVVVGAVAFLFSDLAVLVTEHVGKKVQPAQVRPVRFGCFT